jgi:small subunit ribosomal protein S6
LIINPNISEEEVEDQSQKIKKIIEGLGASIIHNENWGKRRLAYEVKKFKKGYYLVYDYQVESNNIVKKMDASFRYDERILKYMTVNMKESNILKGPAAATTARELLEEPEEAVLEDDE